MMKPIDPSQQNEEPMGVSQDSRNISDRLLVASAVSSLRTHLDARDRLLVASAVSSLRTHLDALLPGNREREQALLKLDELEDWARRSLDTGGVF